ncbi:MAG: FG-GAP repeat protein [Planctomycetota bacterium]
MGTPGIALLAAEDPCQVAKILASDGEAHSAFGADVAMYGTLALVGAVQNDDNGEESGAAYLFDISDPNSPIEIAKLLADDGQATDYFGAYLDLTADTAVVGQGGDVEAAYVFDITNPANPVQIAKLQASDGVADDGFGWHNAIDGDTIVVGALWHADIGAAYVFRDQGGGNWTEVQKLTPSDGESGDNFGYAVAVSGAFAVVGAYGSDDAGNGSGSAYIFHEDGNGSWTETHKLTASDASPVDTFGRAAAIDGDLIIVGARQADPGGAVYVFRASTGEELAKIVPQPEDYGFGWDVALRGTRAIVGCSSEAAYIFDLADPTNPVQIARIAASDAAEGDNFGKVVAIDGYLSLVGAWRNADEGEDTGSAYLFDDCSDCPSDISGDDHVNVDDLVELLLAWGPCGDCAADVNEDGMVDIDDLLSAILAWGPCDDCNGNGIHDDDDLAAGTSTDCNGTGVPDDCELADNDCNANGIPDECEADCNGNGLPDDCETDCNCNGINDAEEIASGDASDCNDDGMPDDCQPLPNDTCGTASTLMEGETALVTCPASTGTMEEPMCGMAITNDVWYRHLAQCAGTLSVVVEADFDAVVSVYAGSCPSGPGEAIACGQGMVSFEAVAGSLYRFRIGGADGASGSGIVVLSCEP